jgi:hypothetical protein
MALALTFSRRLLQTQFILNPPYLVFLFAWMGVLEGQVSPAEIAENVQVKTTAAMLPNFAFWPIANFINFSFVPAAWRVPCKSAAPPSLFCLPHLDDMSPTITTRWRSHLHFTFSRRLLQTWRPAAAFGTRISPY